VRPTCGIGGDALTELSVPEILEKCRTIAVVGCSKDPSKDAHTVPAYMQGQGYRIIPVNPTASEILGEKAYPNVSAIPEPYDLVNIFRPSGQVGPIVDEAIRAGKAKVIWMQLGISDEAAADRAKAAGMHVVMDLCLRTEHRFRFR
jgi:predicted CoA-binding protein